MKAPAISCLALALLASTFVLPACEGGAEPAREQLLTSWAKFYEAEDASFNVELTFRADGTFSWELLDPVPTHTNSSGQFEASDTQVRLVNDPDCPGTGVYNYTVSDDRLVISLESDACTPRIPGFSGVWLRSRSGASSVPGRFPERTARVAGKRPAE